MLLVNSITPIPRRKWWQLAGRWAWSRQVPTPDYKLHISVTTVIAVDVQVHILNFRVMKPYGVADEYCLFGGTRCLHFRCRPWDPCTRIHGITINNCNFHGSANLRSLI